MSILNAYYPDSEPIIKPSDLQQPILGFPKLVVGCFRPFEHLLFTYDAEEIEEAKNRIVAPVWRVNYKGCEIALFQSRVGAPVTVAGMERLRAMGAEQFLFYGYCGVLDRAITRGGILVPTAAYRDEGTSYHYAPPDDDYIEVKTARALMKILANMKLPYVTTKTWTTDAFYRETRAAMEARRAEGCGVVEMECASIMAAAQFYGIAAWQFFFAEDCLDGAAWDRRNLGHVPQDEQERWLQISLEIAHRILALQ